MAISFLRDDIKDMREEMRNKLSSLETKIDTQATVLGSHVVDDTKKFAELTTGLSTEQGVRKDYTDRFLALLSIIGTIALGILEWTHH